MWGDCTSEDICECFLMKIRLWAIFHRVNHPLFRRWLERDARAQSASFWKYILRRSKFAPKISGDSGPSQYNDWKEGRGRSWPLVLLL